MQLTINEKEKSRIFDTLKIANKSFQQVYPGDRSDRQPVHTVYGGADLFTKDSAAKMAQVALKTYKAYCSNFIELARIIQLNGYEGLPDDEKSISSLIEKTETGKDCGTLTSLCLLAKEVHHKIIDKLKREAVEDFRIDFEDGFGNRSWEEEDKTATQAAIECASGMKANSLPPFIGIRIKPFTEDLKERSLRTLDIFLTVLAKEANGILPDNFVVMLPKVTIPDQVGALVDFFEIIEANTAIHSGALKMEMMVETTQSILDENGINPLRSFYKASKGRMIATAFGTYDYTASNNITAQYQDMGHPVCDFAHYIMKVGLTGTGIWLSDGATNIMPIGPHRGDKITALQQEENKAVVHNSWKKAYDHTRHSLYNGLYQGWDLHPAQFPMRYAAIFAFFLESYQEAAARLKAFMQRSAQATLTGDVFDDAATGQGLLNYFLRGLNCGALTKEQLFETGLTLDEIKSRSFYRILEGRKE